MQQKITPEQLFASAKVARDSLLARRIKGRRLLDEAKDMGMKSDPFIMAVERVMRAEGDLLLVMDEILVSDESFRDRHLFLALAEALERAEKVKKASAKIMGLKC